MLRGWLAALGAFFRTLYHEHPAFIQLLILFVVFRVLSVLFLRIGGFFVSGGPDQVYFHAAARLTAADRYPFIDFWMEYPPLFPWLSVLAYKISLGMAGDNFLWFNTILRWLFLPFEAGSLILIYLTAGKLYDNQAAIRAAQGFGLLFLPLFILLNWFDNVALFFVLLGLYGLVIDRPLLAGLGIGWGFGAKLFPVAIFPAAVKVFRERRRLALLCGGLLAGLVTIFGPFLLIDPTQTIAFFKTLGGRTSWETIWALMEGYSGYGIVAPLSIRNDPAAVSWVPPTAPETSLPWLWITLGVGLIGLFLWTRRIDWSTPKRSTGFAAMTFMIMLLYAKGYSPQWGLFPAALAVALLPDLRGITYGILFSIVTVLEWPVAFVTLEDVGSFLVGVIIIRTLLMLILTFEFAGMAYPAANWLRRIRRYLPGASTAGLILVAIIAAGPIRKAYREAELAKEPLAPVIEAIRAAAPTTDPVIVVQASLVERLTPYLGGEQIHMLPNSDTQPWVGSVDGWTQTMIEGHDRAWLLLDNTDETYRPLFDEMHANIDRQGCAAEQRWYGAVWAEHYVLAESFELAAVGVDFDGGLRLAAAAPPDAPVTAGMSFCLELAWEVRETPQAEYLFFAYLIGPDGALAASSDLYPPTPTAAWAAGETMITRQGLILPGHLASGTYSLEVGIYDPAAGARVPLTNGDSAVVIGMVEVR